MILRFAEAALGEYVAAARYYNQQIPGLGNAFADEVEAGTQRISSARGFGGSSRTTCAAAC